MSEISARCFLFVGNISATICKNLIFKIFYLVRKVFLICAKSDICCISFPIENEIKKAQNNVLYHSFAYKTLKNLAEKNGGKIETSLSDNRLAITTGWVINNFS